MRKKLTKQAVGQLHPEAKPYEVRDTEINGFMLRVQPSGCMTYYLVYLTSNGRKRRIVLGKHGTLTPIQARDAASYQAGRVAQGIDPQAEKKTEKVKRERADSIKLENFITNKYEPWATNHMKTGADTIRRIKTCFPSLLNRKLTEINDWVIESWRSKRSKAGKSSTTINRDVAALRSVLTKAVNWKVIDRHPLEHLKPLKVDTTANVRYLSPEEMTCLREALESRESRIRAERHSANQWRLTRGKKEYPNFDNLPYVDHLMPMILLSINTGLRRGEIFNLGWQHINFAEETLTVVGTHSKNGNTRHVPLNDEAHKVLTQLNSVNNSTNLVFPGKDGKPFDNVQTAWSNLLQDAGINHFRWHDMRHHFASMLVMNDVNLYKVMKLLGHSDIKTTMRYAHLSAQGLADAVNTLTQTYSTQKRQQTELRVV